MVIPYAKCYALNKEFGWFKVQFTNGQTCNHFLEYCKGIYYMGILTHKQNMDTVMPKDKSRHGS